jgi:hypothetical protein
MQLQTSFKKTNILFRYRHEICCYGERLYVLGGGTSFSVYGFDRIPTFDLQTKTWSSSKTRPDENATIDVVGVLLWSRVADPDPHYFRSWIRFCIRVKSWIGVRM